VSALCRDRMHEFVAEELGKEGAAFLRRRQEWLAGGAGAGAETSAAAFVRGPRGAWPEREEEERAWRSALRRSFRRADAMAALACACGRVARPSCRCPLSSVVSGIVGSTAVVALLVRGRLVVANCGDSRAVLCRGPAGTPPVPLSSDHKVCTCVLRLSESERPGTRTPLLYLSALTRRWWWWSATEMSQSRRR
jgi:protein phosphatase 2C